ncbi:MAG TPA: hypothetical protein VJG32_22835 [Anaerolineae bacterium]|nr:hypothetical protein [Anaerolineae bacterium]
MAPRSLMIEELPFIALVSLPIIIWGLRHGLDAVLIAVAGALFGMLFADTLANGVVGFVNTFWRLGKAMLEAGFEPNEELLGNFRGQPPLIETPDQVRVLGSIIFLLITYVAFRIAFKRKGGRGSLLEGIFGAIGGAVTGYLIVTFLLPRHFQLPQEITITETQQLPVFNLDASVIVLIALVVIVFGVQRSPKKKKDEKK